MRSIGFAVPFVLLIVACGGSGRSSSPTEPTPPSADPVSLEGNWSGSVTISSPTPVTCTLSMKLSKDVSDYNGDWDAKCSDGKHGTGIAFANLLIFNQVLVAGVLGQPVFGGCGWASGALREGNRIHGDWSTPQGCQTGPVLLGKMELTKQ